MVNMMILIDDVEKKAHHQKIRVIDGKRDFYIDRTVWEVREVERQFYGKITYNGSKRIVMLQRVFGITGYWKIITKSEYLAS